MTTSVVDNGVNVAALLGAREAFADSPEIARFQWRSSVTWVNGTHSTAELDTFSGFGSEQRHSRTFAFDIDHPLQFAAEDNGITPVEYVLVALGGCLTAGIAAVAQQRGIQLRSVRADVAAEMDLHGILGADPEVRNGFSGVRVDYRIDADAGQAEIEALVAQSQKRSAVYDILTNPHRRHGDGELTMWHTTTVVIGAGHSGLAMSRCLAALSVDHVVLERGEVAHSWRTQRWDSLRLLTPNWMTRLPGHAYSGDDPDGYLEMPQVIRLLEGYATGAPVLTGVTVTSVQPHGLGYVVRTDQGAWLARTVVVATGASAAPARQAVPLPPGIPALTAADYRNPGQLPEGGVLVVGASASGIQIADELARSGRPVTLAVGEHVRMPRTYRGRDILWWMDASGVLDERWDAVPDLVRARNLPSMQLVGAPRTLDLNTLGGRGVALVGRLAGARDGAVLFSGSLANVCTLADLKLGRLLDTFDAWADRMGVEAEAPQRFAPTAIPAPALSARLGRGGIESVVWATGFRPDLSFLQVPVVDRKGRVVHDGGVTAAPGLYVVGLPFLRRRKSTLIDGAGADARDLADHLVGHLDSQARQAS